MFPVSQSTTPSPIRGIYCVQYRRPLSLHIVGISEEYPDWRNIYAKQSGSL
ncbi:hypothetical protein PHLCEN_2v9688 [Hermanssonia centrifuga]|uniref:Uncharacterized protein n=1 Tax=Hermanssonia centrifuga TaxID=98765 RepID=A0A2R6NQU7_9APHY|nr:hypothetical protein PHLCEN_2v9688 [Hermanssonia centrifuga]